MNHPKSSPKEAVAFADISDFIIPDGQLDKEAVDMFLSGFLMKKNTQHTYGNQEQCFSMGYLLKIAEPDSQHWSESFKKFYLLWRQQHEDYFHEWFDSVDPQRKEQAKLCMLKLLEGAPPVSDRVSLMMDGMQHYPEMTVQSFIGKSLLRIKPPAFAKALRPRLPVMRLMLKMAKDLKAAAPEYSELANAIAMAVFVERMNQKPPSNSSQRGKSAVEAFLLMVDEGIEVDVQTCLRLAQSRFKDKYLQADMLCFPQWALASHNKNNWLMREPSEKEKKMAVQMLPLQLKELLKDNCDQGNMYDSMLVEAHKYISCQSRANPNSEDSAYYDQIKQMMAEFFLKRHSSMEHGFLYVLDNIIPEQNKEHFWANWYKSQNVDNVNQLVRKEVYGTARDYMYPVVRKNYVKRILASVSTQELGDILQSYARETFRKKPKDFETHWSSSYPQERRDAESLNSFMQSMLRALQRLSSFTTPELRDNSSHKQLIASCAMTYLYYGSSHNAVYSPTDKEFLNLSSEPLPLLRSLYPEHTAAINAMRKDLVRKIQSCAAVTPGEDKTKKVDYYGTLFNVVGGAMYEKANLNLSVVSQLLSSFEMPVFDYFSSLQMQQDVQFEMSGDVFAGMEL